MTFVLTLQSHAQNGDYVIGPQDMLMVGIFDQPELSGKYTVEADGTFTFPLIGRIKAGGLSIKQFETELKKKLSDGFFRNPQVSVGVELYRSQRIFIVGEVRSPGMYTLTGDMTLIEGLARAGAGATDEVLVVRPKNPIGNEPVLPEQSGDKVAEVIRINLKDLQQGELSQNVALHDGDTIFVPRASMVYIFGQVRSPGAYPIQKDTTVLQALSLAGGVTDRGALGRTRIIRLLDGKKKEIKVQLGDVMQAGDTMIVPERFF